MATNRGSIPTGPSEQYLRLLKGEITPEEYARSVKQRVEASGNGNRSDKTGAQRKRA